MVRISPCPRSAGPALVLVAVVLLAGGGARSASAAGLVSRLLGAPPDSTAARQETGPTLRPALDDALDRGFVTPEELLLRRFGADVGRNGADVASRAIDLTGVGRGRSAWVVDGVARNDGLVHWDAPFLIPLRALRRFGEADPLGDVRGGRSAPPVPEARADSSGLRDLAGDDLVVPPGTPGAIDARMARGPARPASTVGLTGGDYGSRLGSFNFRRRFGRAGVNVDGASLRQDGWGDFGRNTRDTGALRLDLPAGGGGLAITVGTGKGEVDFIEGGTESQSESRLVLDYRRALGRRWLRFGLERSSSGLELAGFGVEPYDLTSNRVRITAGWGPADGAAGVALAAGAARESRRGLLDGSEHWLDLEGLARWRGRAFGAWRPTAQLVLRRREQTGVSLEPGVALDRSWRGTAFRVAAGQSTALPGIVLHTGSARVNRLELEAVLDRILDRDRPETHRYATAALSGGGRFRWAVRGGVVSTTDYAGALIPALALVPGSAFFPTETTLTTPRADVAFHWRPAASVELGAMGHVRGLDPERVPWASRWGAEGWVTLRRLYFAPDLNLGGTLAGRLVGSRTSGFGDVAPTAFDGSFTLTATIRTLTLFWRIENMGAVAIESDLNDSSGIPILLPGLNNRIGATLHLLD